MIAERLKKVRSFIGLIQSKNCNRLFADIAGVGAEFLQETDLFPLVQVGIFDRCIKASMSI